MTLDFLSIGSINKIYFSPFNKAFIKTYSGESVFSKMTSNFMWSHVQNSSLGHLLEFICDYPVMKEAY